MLRDDEIRIKHMLDAAIEAQVFTQDITRENLENDRKTIQAVIRCIEIIGEAAAKISQDTKIKYPQIPWHKIIGMRNWLIHDYFDIDYGHIWSTVREDIPMLIQMIENMLKKDKNNAR